MTINEIITIIDVLVITTYYFYLHCYVDFKMRLGERTGRKKSAKKATNETEE